MAKVVDGIDISSLLRARDVFERFRKSLNTEQEKAGAIQSFEFCYELSWKMMKRILEARGLDVKSPRDAFRQATVNKLISSPEPWFDFLVKRNLTSHCYDQKYVDFIVNSFDDFSREINIFIDNLG